MSAAPLSNVSSGSDIFLDANILVYALCSDSIECVDLLRRCATEDICGVTSLDVINDVTHKLMLREARDAGIITRPRADLLNARLHRVSELSLYWQQIQRLLKINLLIVRSDVSWLDAANTARLSHGLLTNDSLIVAAMWDGRLTYIASADSDFDRVPGLVRYAPTDLAAAP